MADESLLPYFHPTTVVGVDDNQLFLHTLDLRMPADMAYQLYHDPRRALAYVNQKLSLPTIPERCLKCDRAKWQGTIHFDLSMIEEEIKVTDRFKRTSVVIVDYAMPHMSGLEFCNEIHDPTVKKVLLTGVADEKIAVKAFNDGLIDRYISKSSNETLDLVVSFARTLQRAYLVDQQRILLSTLALELPPFLADSGVRAWIQQHRARNDYVEHYLVADPPGFIMLNADAEMCLFVIASEERMQNNIAYAEAHGAPADVLRDLRERRKLGYFFDRPDFADRVYPWRDYLHDAVMLGGEYWGAAVTTPPADIDFDPELSSYRSHLLELDRAA